MYSTGSVIIEDGGTLLNSVRCLRGVFGLASLRAPKAARSLSAVLHDLPTRTLEPNAVANEDSISAHVLHLNWCRIIFQRVGGLSGTRVTGVQCQERGS